MLLKVALVLLLAWVVGALNVDRIGSAVHLLLLVGLMLLLLGVLKTRDASILENRETSKPPRER